MSHKKLLQMMGAMLIVVSLGCGMSATTPVSEVPAAADTSESPAAANTPQTSPPKTLLKTAGQLCDNAFVTFNPNVPLISGAAASPVLTLKAITEIPQGKGPWSWSLHPVLDAVEATSAETVRALVCIMERRMPVAKYDDGSRAYRLDWIVLLVQWPEGNVFGYNRFMGENPPEKVPAGQSAGVGNEPTGEFSKWLRVVTENETILHPGPVNSVVFSPDGQTLAVGGDGMAVHLWDLTTEEETGPLLNIVKVYGITYSPDGQTIASAGFEEIRFWEVATKKEISPIEGIATGSFLAYSPDGKMLATGDKKIIRLLEVATGKEISVLTAEGKNVGVTKVVFSPDGKLLVVQLTWAIEVWEVGSGALKWTFSTKEAIINDVDISPDGKSVAMGFKNGVVKQWNLATGEERVTKNEIESGDLAIFSVAYSPDGKFLATGQANGVGLWDTATGTLIRTYEGHSSLVTSVNFSPDGQKLASGSYDGTVMIWDVRE